MDRETSSYGQMSKSNLTLLYEIALPYFIKSTVLDFWTRHTLNEDNQVTVDSDN